MSSDNSNLAQLRICVEKTSPMNDFHLSNMKEKSNSDGHFEKLKAAFLTSALWPKRSKITISFMSDGSNVKWTPESTIKQNLRASNQPDELDPLSSRVMKMSPVKAVTTIIKERIIPLVDLDISFVKTGGIIRIDFNPLLGSWSYIGTECKNAKANEATINYGWLDVGTIIHECGHMLGLIHEHQNPKGKLIEWDKQKQGWNKDMVNKNIIDRYDVNQINGSEFDPNSIMLYFFSADLTKNNRGTHANVRLSRKDVQYINKMYPGSEMTPAEFYKYAYNENIDSKSGGTSEKLKNFVKSKKFLYIIIGIVIFLIILGLIIFIKKIKIFSRNGSARKNTRTSYNRYR
jgi:hypothetical protein